MPCTGQQRDPARGLAARPAPDLERLVFSKARRRSARGEVILLKIS